MSKSPDQSPLRQDYDRPPPLQSVAAATSTRSSLQKTSFSGKETYLPKAFGFPFRSLLREPEEPIPPPTTGEVAVDNSPYRSLKENSLDFPLRYPARRSENQVQLSIPQTNREASFPALPLRSSLRGTGNKPSPASQQPLSTQNENASKSLGRDETVIAMHHQSVLEDTGIPILQTEISPEKQVVTSRVAAPLSTMEAGSPILQTERWPEKQVVTSRMAASLSMMDDGSPILQTERSPEKQVVTSRMAAPLSTTEAKVGRGRVNGMHVKSGFLRRAPMRKAEFGLRVLEVVLCMISFSVMAADKTKGWAGDSFDRYQEFRYCISMNVIAFVYSLFQVYAQFHHMMKEKDIIDSPLSYYADFFMDQVLAYLLLSASSAAAARNDDWISMFGSDKFTDMMNGSIAMSFLAFFAFALSSIISAEKLFTWKP